MSVEYSMTPWKFLFPGMAWMDSMMKRTEKAETVPKKAKRMRGMMRPPVWKTEGVKGMPAPCYNKPMGMVIKRGSSVS
jgi:hypothetical protein